MQGYNGQVDFDGNQVTIYRKGAIATMSVGFAGEKNIPISSVLSVQYKKASAMLNGFIQFETASGKSVGSLSAATRDENSIVFTSYQNEQFENLRRAVEKAISTRSSSTHTVVTNTSVAEQLEKLVGLHEKGILTKEELEVQKSKLLDS